MDFARAARPISLACLSEAETLEDARAFLAEQTPDCVVVDMHLPDGEGLELLAEYPRLPFIVLTGHDDQTTARRALNSGAQDYLVKGNLSPELVERAIRYALERKAHHLTRESLAHQDRLASLGSLAASVAHEINNPIAFVAANLGAFRDQNSAYAALLVKLAALAESHAELRALLDEAELPADPGEAERMLRESASGIERIVSIVRQLGAFARGPEAAEAPQSVSLTEVASWAVMLTRKTIEARATLVTELDPSLPPFVGRPGRLAQVVTNLLVNSSQAMDSADAAHRIWLRTSQTEDHLHLTVEDTGTGFSDKAKERAFEPFYTTKARGEGTGLGLAVARDIVRSHGGSLELGNRPEGGARVTMTLPKDTGIRLSRPAPGARPSSSPERRFRILLIDDEPAIRRAYARMLRPHEIIWDSAEGALERVTGEKADTRFDLILCDLMMPGIDGVTFYRILQQQQPALLGRLVFLTGGVYQEAARRFLEQVPNRLLVKPVSKSEILLAAEAIALGGDPSA